MKEFSSLHVHKLHRPPPLPPPPPPKTREQNP